MINDILINSIFACVACLGFAKANKPPKRVLFFSALLGGVGFSVRYILMRYELLGIAFGSLAGAFAVGLCAVFLARRLSSPIEVIAFPALLPMVPGVYAYKSVLAIFLFMKSVKESEKVHHLMEFFNNLFITMSVALCLGVGISVVLLLFYERSFTMTRHAKLSELYKDELKKYE